MKRLYFLAPNITVTTAIAKELEEFGVYDSHIHIVGKDHTKIVGKHLHEASPLQTSEVLPALRTGALTGCAVGAAAGVVMATFPLAGIVIEGFGILLLSAFGAGFGAWVSAMIGIGIPNHEVEKYKDAIKKGQLLMIVDVPKWHCEDVMKMIKQHHPEAIIKDVQLTEQQQAA